MFRFHIVLLVLGLLLMYACNHEEAALPEATRVEILREFPPFITPVEDYFYLSIGDIPELDTSYRLSVSGAIENPSSFSLEELREMTLSERMLTVECIGNLENGSLVANAEWKGIHLYDFLSKLGISEEATTVKYICADGYFTFNTLEELKTMDVMGALYINDEVLPRKMGFPFRVVFPGYYGVRQAGWVTGIEVLEGGPEDFWEGSGWKTDVPMQIDSRFFFPLQHTEFSAEDSILIGGAAYGSSRVTSVEISTDGGQNWQEASIRRREGQDFTWVFWDFLLMPGKRGTLKILARAKGADGSIQAEKDSDGSDGWNAWPSLVIKIQE